MIEKDSHSPQAEPQDLLNRYNPNQVIPKEKPWGTTIGIHPTLVANFIHEFFPLEEVGQEPSPRFLVVNAGSRLSWQKHLRRSEIWRVIKGPIGVMRSMTDEQPTTYEVFEKDSLVHIEPYMRHRLIGLEERGIVAEVWIHTDIQNPSDANDIERIDDDYER